MNKRLVSFCQYAVIVINIAILAFLTYYSLRYSWEFYEIGLERALDQHDSLLRNIVFLSGMTLIGIGFMILFRIAAMKKSQEELWRTMDIVAICGTLLYAGLGIVWVLLTRSFPYGNDAGIIWSAACMFKEGIYGTFVGNGYFVVYPQQLGLFTIELISFKLLGSTSLIPLQILNALYAGLLFYAGYRITRLLCKKPEVAVIYMLMMFFCLQLFLFIPYAYGELPFMACAAAVCWWTAEYFNGEKIRYAILSAVFMLIGVLYRKNILIFLIALVIIYILKVIRDRKPKLLISVAVISALAILVPKGLVVYYNNVTQGEIGKGVPTVAFITMGFTDSWNGPGWYNDYNRVTFQLSNNDSKVAAETARFDLQCRIDDMKEDPGATKEFFKRKILSQWNEPTYEAFFSNYNFEAHEPSEGIVEKVFYGDYYETIRSFMNRYQSCLYGFALICLLGMTILSIRKSTQELEIAAWLPLIYVIGGFLFYILWEAKSRYVLPYAVMLIPYASAGIQYLVGCMDKLLMSVLNKKEKDV